MMYLFLIILTLISGCSHDHRALSTEKRVVEQFENEQGLFELSYDADTYQFTDSISLSLFVQSEKGFILPDSLPEPGAIWGDFTVEKRFRNSGQNVSWILSPNKTGISILKGLELQVNSENEQYLIKFSDREIEILSSLMNDSGEPVDLLPPEKKREFPLSAVLILTGVLIMKVVFYLILRKRKHKKKQESERNSAYYLQKLRGLVENPNFKGLDRKDQYRELYSILSFFLYCIAPSLRTGLEPSFLLKELEKPSSLNQWALRSLYPVLQEAQNLFYNPAHPVPDEQTLKGHLRNSIECCEFLQKEEASHV